MTVFNIRIASSGKVLAAALFVSMTVMLALTAMAPVAHAQALDTQALLDRIDRLERDIRTLNQQLARTPAEVPAETPAAAETPGTPPVAQIPAASKLEFNAAEGSLSRVMVRVGALEQEVRTATGQGESMSHGIDQLNARLDKLVVDLDYRLSRLEGSAPGSYGPMGNAPAVQGNPSSAPQIAAAPKTASVSKAGDMPPVGAGGSEKGTVLENGLYQPGAGDGNVMGTVSKTEVDKIAAQEKAMSGEAAPQTEAQTAPQAEAQTVAPEQVASAPPAEPAETAVLPTGSVTDRYKFAFNLTRQARYEEAEIAFKAFIKAHGEDALAGNAHYWLGETYYVRKNFMHAAQAFFEAYQKFPSGAKAPDSLLKLGMSMSNMDKSSEACTTYGKLRREFSGAMKAPIEQALNRETQRLKCE